MARLGADQGQCRPSQPRVIRADSFHYFVNRHAGLMTSARPSLGGGLSSLPPSSVNEGLWARIDAYAELELPSSSTRS